MDRRGPRHACRRVRGDAGAAVAAVLSLISSRSIHILSLIKMLDHPVNSSWCKCQMNFVMLMSSCVENDYTWWKIKPICSI